MTKHKLLLTLMLALAFSLVSGYWLLVTPAYAAVKTRIGNVTLKASIR